MIIIIIIIKEEKEIMKKLNSEKLNIKPPLVQSKIKPPSGPCF